MNSRIDWSSFLLGAAIMCVVVLAVLVEQF